MKLDDNYNNVGYEVLELFKKNKWKTRKDNT